MSDTVYAHTLPGRSCDEWEPLGQHLQCVADRAAEFADAFGAAAWAELLGLWHDLGKYDPDWQAYLRRAGNPDSHLEDEAAGRRGPPHAIVGALHAIERFGPRTGRCLAFCIAGHHAGLPDWQNADAPDGSLENRLRIAQEKETTTRIRRSGAPANILGRSMPAVENRFQSDQLAFWIRMLFSALVDADFLATEAALDEKRPEARAGLPLLDPLLPALDDYIDAKMRRAKSSEVNRARAEVLASCRERAALAPGLFTLTVPTGGGKTLASLAFALRHAKAHGLSRVIYAIPYTSIIEQTAEVFREAFHALGEVVVEHHTNLAPQKETVATRLASENWDAPLVVTTTVQLFESMFAAKPSRCRKLHNLARAVLILDEAQLLPPEHLRPILFALDELIARYGTTVVLSTATQPALLEREDFHGLVACRRELAPDPEALRRRLKRVHVDRLHGLERAATWPELADELAINPRVLCIVDRRDAARELHGLLPEGTFHLSALMYPAHRCEVLADIRAALAEPEREVRVVATQLVEAGVDLDFPVVYRAIAGLDSIAQAAGRCNREGTLSVGRMVVFRPPTEPPPGVLRMAAGIGDKLLRRGAEDPLTLTAFDAFFRELYWLKHDLDAAGLLTARRLLARPDLAFAFRTAAEKFKIIKDEQIPVLVPLGEGARIARELEIAGPSRERLRRAQRFTVGVYRHTAGGLLKECVARELVPGLLLLDDARLYDEVTGLQVDRVGIYDPHELMM